MAIYHNEVVSGKGSSLTIYSGDSAYDTIVRNSAALRVSFGGYIENTTVRNGGTTVSNAGIAEVVVLSSGTMYLSSGGTANSVSVLNGARLTVSSGGVATGVYASGGNVNTTVYGGDTATRIEGTNELGSFSLSDGVASHFVLNSNGQLMVLSGGTALDTVLRMQAALTVSTGGVATGIVQGVGGKLTTTLRGGDATTVVSGSNVSGTFRLSNGVAENFILYENTAQYISNGGVALRTTISSGWGHQYVYSGGIASVTVISRGSMTVHEGGIGCDVTVSSGGTMWAAGGRVSRAAVGGVLLVSAAPGDHEATGGSSLLSDVLIVSGGTMSMFNGARIFDLVVASGARVNLFPGAVLGGEKLDIAEGTIYYGGDMLGMTASNGEVLGLGADGKAYNIAFGSGVTVTGATVAAGEKLTVSSGAALKNATVASGGFLTLVAGADTGERLYFDFSDPSGGVIETRVNDLSLVSSDTAICLTGLSEIGDHTVASGISRVVYCMPDELYENAVVAGGSYTNAFAGRTYELDGAGRKVTVSDFTIDAVCPSATPVDTSGTVLNDIDLAAVWTNFEVASSGTVCAAADNFYGDAWLKLEGTKLTGAQLFGASAGVEFDGYINLLATSGAVIRNLAAGAGAGGYVGGVLLTIDDAALAGAGYAGGFGTVYDPTRTLIKTGSFAKDFYAGALANYTKTRVTTTVGSVYLTVGNGSFSGNLYGASAVKSDTATQVHTVDDVTISIEGGTTDKDDFCLFAGGYATGTAGAGADYVYSVLGDVDLTVSGGSWGPARSGRGIFGGIMASGVAANVLGDVNLTISGGTMGNVHGGGWAQKGGRSEVGNVNLAVKGGTMTNVYGGGSVSTSGGSSVVTGEVVITVSGGNITGGIFARGQFDGESVTNADVIFTGATDFGCGVWGYGRPGDAEDGDATLSFSTYTGSFSGAIGGFDGGITFAGNTEMTLAAEGENVSNETWIFDTAERVTIMAGTAFLNWSDADFAGDTITLNLATGDANEWHLVGAAGSTVYNKFDVRVDGTSILSEKLDLDQAIEGGAYDGWGFTNDGGTLKFKHLA